MHRIGSVEIVDRQLAAYNARDADAFAACYSEDVVVEDARSTSLMRGRNELRSEYETFFRENAALRGEIRDRIVIGDYVIDHEEIHGWQKTPVRAVAVYHVSDGMIDHVRLYEDA
jgi:uncharacterized protein (TIGR02246 family)